MSSRTSVILGITGAILTFAVSGHPAVVDIQLAGVILMATGAIGLWPLGGKAWLHLGRARLRQFVDETAPVQGIRVPLDDLMIGRRTAHAGPGRPGGGDHG